LTVAAVVTQSAYALAGTNLGPFATVFPYEQPSDVEVWLFTGAAWTAVEGADFTLAATGGDSLANGGTVTLNPALLPGAGAWVAGSAVALVRATSADQPSAFGEAMGFSPAASEAALDHVARQAQDLTTLRGGAVLASPGEIGFYLPPGATRANKLAWFDPDGVLMGLAGNADMGGFRLTDMGEGIADGDAVNLAQLNALNDTLTAEVGELSSEITGLSAEVSTALGTMATETAAAAASATAASLSATSAAASAAQAMAVPYTITPLSFRNRLINGDMRFDQRNNGATGTAAVYTVDRWKWAATAVKGIWGQDLNVITPPAGFKHYLGFQSSGAYAVGPTDLFVWDQPIEGVNVADLLWGTAGALEVTLSFWVYVSTAGNYGGALRNGAANRSYPFLFNVPSAYTWTYITVSVPGDTAGTWATDTTSGLEVILSLGAGSTWTHAAGAWASGNYLQATGSTSVVATFGGVYHFTGVQLEVGSVATAFERRPYALELALCQRYYTTAPVNVRYYAGGVGQFFDATIAFKATMRAAPTVTLTAGARANVASVSTVATADACRYEVTPTGAGDTYAVGDVLAASAEL